MIVCLTCLVCVLEDPRLLLKDPCTLDDITTTMSSDLGLHGCEVLPLVRSSACTDPATGVVMQAIETPEVSSSDSALSSQHVIPTLVEGQSTVRSCCAAEQRTAWGLHAPVECTELDLQYLSNAPELQTFRPSDFIARNIPQCPQAWFWRTWREESEKRKWKRRLLKWRDYSCKHTIMINETLKDTTYTLNTNI